MKDILEGIMNSSTLGLLSRIVELHTDKAVVTRGALRTITVKTDDDYHSYRDSRYGIRKLLKCSITEDLYNPRSLEDLVKLRTEYEELTKDEHAFYQTTAGRYILTDLVTTGKFHMERDNKGNLKPSVTNPSESPVDASAIINSRINIRTKMKKT